jgi:GNAT superfamily N-acetyltransferase
MSQPKIQLITPEQVYPLRHRVLRPHQDFAASKYPDDLLPTTFHVGALLEGNVIGIATFSLESHPEVSKAVPARCPYRLRGMATDTHLHQRGVGTAVLHFSFEELRRRHGDLLWCNAREVAFPFYEKMGFLTLGAMFEIPGIGPHKVMYKTL